MSTGADCSIIEEEPGKWYYYIQDYPYGEIESYKKHGPFSSDEKAIKHLDKKYANPGGFSIEPYRK